VRQACVQLHVADALCDMRERRCASGYPLLQFAMRNPTWALLLLHNLVQCALTASTRDMLHSLRNATVGPNDQLEQASRQLKAWRQDGLIILRAAFSSDLMLRACSEFDQSLWHQHQFRRPPAWLDITSPGTYQGNRTVPLRLASQRVRLRSYRLKDAALIRESVWEQIANDERLLSVIEALIGPTGRLVSSLLFERGSQQSLHDDTWYYLASDAPAGLVGVWVALEDVHVDSGPLTYIPGSHRRPEVVLNRNADVKDRRLRLAFPFFPSSMAPLEMQDAAYRDALKWVAGNGLRVQRFLAQVGDVGIWSERLLHGGDHVKNWFRTRRSLVLHYRASG